MPEPRKIEFHRSYGETHGDGEPYAYEQDGLYFDAGGNEVEIPGGPKMGAEILKRGGPLTPRTDPRQRSLVNDRMADVPYSVERLQESLPADQGGMATMELAGLRDSVDAIREEMASMRYETDALRAKEAEKDAEIARLTAQLAKASGGSPAPAAAKAEESGVVLTAEAIKAMNWHEVRAYIKANKMPPAASKEDGIAAILDVNGFS